MATMKLQIDEDGEDFKKKIIRLTAGTEVTYKIIEDIDGLGLPWKTVKVTGKKMDLLRVYLRYMNTYAIPLDEIMEAINYIDRDLG